FDQVLKDHLERSKEGTKGRATYLSPLIQNEFIVVLGNSVREKLVGDVRESKDYGVMCDSTPDISHQDQHSLVVRYVTVKQGKISVKDPFLGYMNLEGKDAESIEEGIRKGLQSFGLDFNNCRAVCFDNAGAMVGRHTYVQRRLCERNSKIVFIKSNNHCLNFASVNIVKSGVGSMTFFNILNQIFNFFSRSTAKWDTLKKVTAVTLKSSTDTRWSSRAEATCALQNELDGVLEVLESISSSDKFSTE
ncbi:zinc finger MYM-type protein 1-like, partial [Palaemon carinicauda]|uniref:zinc finger MYM-type protein 1-like n=1 Tax=Palaemon carinicauda TaxID=392227 RepID=UPI0035B5E864